MTIIYIILKLCLVTYTFHALAYAVHLVVCSYYYLQYFECQVANPILSHGPIGSENWVTVPIRGHFHGTDDENANFSHF